MNKKTLLTLSLVFVLLMGGAYALYSKLSGEYRPDQLSVQTTQPANPDATDGSEQNSEPQRVALPDFVVYDREGNEVRLSDYQGKPVVLNFWASWCGPCQMEMPDFDEAYKRLEGKVEFLMVNVTDGQRETAEKASAFVEERGFSFPIYFDSDLNASTTYGAYSLPTTFFIDAEGYGVAAAKAAINAETLQRGLDLIYTAES